MTQGLLARCALCGLMLAALVAPSSAQQRAASGVSASPADPGLALVPTNHPVLPRDSSLLWLAPGSQPTAPPSASRELATAMKLVDKSEYTKALPMLSQASVQQGPLDGYASLYAGIAQRQMGRPSDARRTFRELQQRRPIGYLSEAAALAEAECDEALNDHKAAAEIYERLSKGKTTAPDDVLMRLGRAANGAGNMQKAGEAFARVYYEFPRGDFAAAAGTEFESLPNVQPIAPGSQRYRLELGRAQRLFGAKQYAPAQAAFERAKAGAINDDRDLVQLRIAECDYFLKRYRDARDGVRPYTEKGTRQAEALYFHAVTMRALGDRPTYLKTIRRIVAEFPVESWAEQALDNLAGTYVREGDDAQADTVFRELYEKYPRGSYGAHAAWKIGWRAYRERRYDESARIFERASADFPRSDYRPAWLYWSGRARELLHEGAIANQRYMLVTADYLNTYYGRLAVARLDGRRAPSRVTSDTPPSLLPPPPNELLVRALLDIDRYDDALNELRFAEAAWGDSAAIQATMAWIYQQQGRSEAGTVRFNLLRASISTMKRAYPQYLAAGGEDLPKDVLAVIFPIDYGDLIKKYAMQQNLDPYLLAALVAQESTFVRDIRSGANAYGLMQLVPATAREYAQRLKLRYSLSLLTNADANIRMGTAYLADKIRQFGDVHLALASYNAGERAVRRWVAERPDVADREEFIDDIPYPETQNYVKRVLGTAEDYRHLYGNWIW
jgi:soluble lytic murein transglycosylase